MTRSREQVFVATMKTVTVREAGPNILVSASDWRDKKDVLFLRRADARKLRDKLNEVLDDG
jgi:hypothetical protein